MRSGQYAEWAPPPDMAHLLWCTWTRSAGPAADVLVLPDGCVDIMFSSAGRLFVAGPDVGPAWYHQESGSVLTGIRLRPGVAGTVLSLAADEIRDARIELHDIWGPAARTLAERLTGLATCQARRDALSAAVRSRIADIAVDGPVVVAAAALRRTDRRIADVAASLGMSERQLHRRFVRQVGYGPKMFQRIMRFRRFLSMSGSGVGHSVATVAAAAGYADQPHLVRDCRQLAGQTPSQLRATWARAS